MGNRSLGQTSLGTVRVNDSLIPEIFSAVFTWVELGEEVDELCHL